MPCQFVTYWCRTVSYLACHKFCYTCFDIGLRFIYHNNHIIAIIDMTKLDSCILLWDNGDHGYLNVSLFSGYFCNMTRLNPYHNECHWWLLYAQHNMLRITDIELRVHQRSVHHLHISGLHYLSQRLLQRFVMWYVSYQIAKCINGLQTYKI